MTEAKNKTNFPYIQGQKYSACSITNLRLVLQIW